MQQLYFSKTHRFNIRCAYNDNRMFNTMTTFYANRFKTPQFGMFIMSLSVVEGLCFCGTLFKQIPSIPEKLPDFPQVPFGWPF